MLSSHTIVLTKDSKKKLNDGAIANNNSYIMDAIGKSATANGWAIKVHNVPEPASGPNHKSVEDLESETTLYHNSLSFTLAHEGNEAPSKNELRSLAKAMDIRGRSPLGGRWNLSAIDGEPFTVADGETLSTKDFVAYAALEIPAGFEENFAHLYGLDSHISRVKRSLNTAINSQFANRYHVALIGPPGCGKSDICETMASVLGDDAVMKFDATATTAAGAIKQLDEAEILPRVLVVEEIEKVNAEALSFLLALMDMRGEIRKTTARAKINKDAKILVVATVNNHELFNNMLAGALASRFAVPLWFHRPSRDVVRRILEREVAACDGDVDWIDPAMDYAEEKKIVDVRVIQALCLTGADGWLDGSFIRELADTDKPQDYDDK